MPGKVRSKMFFSFLDWPDFTERMISFSQIKKLCKGRKWNAAEEKDGGPFISFGTSCSFKVRGPNSRPPQEGLQEEEGRFPQLPQTRLCLQAETGQRKGQDFILSHCAASALSIAIRLHTLAGTWCNVNDYLLCTDLYQVKNHCNLDLICLYNKWFVYTELDALPQLLEISLNDKSLVRPCLGNSETATLPHMPSLY